MTLSRKQQSMLIPGDVVVLSGLSDDQQLTDTVTIAKVVHRDTYYPDGTRMSPLILWEPRADVDRDWIEHDDGHRVIHAQADAGFVSSVVQRAPRRATPLPPTNVYAKRDANERPLFGSHYAYYHRQGNHAAMDLFYGATAVLSTVPGRNIDFMNARKLQEAWAHAGRPGARGVYMLMTGEIRPSLEQLTGRKANEWRNIGEAACWWIHIPTFRRWLLRVVGRLGLNKAEQRVEGIAMAKAEQQMYNDDLDAYYAREDGFGFTNDDGSDYEGPDWGVEDPDTYEDKDAHPTDWAGTYEDDDGIELDPPLFKFDLRDLTDAQLKAEMDRVCDRQGTLGDAEHINEHALARVNEQYTALSREQHRRQCSATA